MLGVVYEIQIQNLLIQKLVVFYLPRKKETLRKRWIQDVEMNIRTMAITVEYKRQYNRKVSVKNL